MAPTVRKTSRSTRANQTDQSVVFTQDEADKALLEAIEQELGAQHFENFSALCKEALKQFFHARQEPATPPAMNNPVELQLTQQITQLQQQLTAIEHTLSQQITHLEQTLSTQGSNQFDEIPNQVARLTLEIDRLEAVRIPIPEPESEASDAISESNSQAEPAQPLPIADPLLNRLSTLLEEF